MADGASSLNTGLPLPSIAWRGEDVSRLILGTVQLGMDYGIANTQGQPDAAKAMAIVETAWRCGIRHFDTAQAYDESEGVLGQALRELGVGDDANVASKLAPSMDPDDIPRIAEAVERTFERLGTGRLWCMMLHRSAWLDHWDRGLGELLRGLRDAGRIEHLGVSLERPGDAEASLAHADMEVLQVAANAWDRRARRLGVFDIARGKGRLCCVRSIFLKGLLTLSPEVVAKRLPFAREASVRWHAVAVCHDIGASELAVRYAMGLGQPLVVGAESPEQVADTVRLARLEPLPGEVVAELEEALDPVVEDRILEPREWEQWERGKGGKDVRA